MFPTVCRVEANTSAIVPTIKYSDRLKKLYCEITFDIILLFGLTELQAQIAFVDLSVSPSFRANSPPAKLTMHMTQGKEERCVFKASFCAMCEGADP